MNLQLQKPLSKWACVNAKQVVVPCDASVRRIPWFVQKRVYVSNENVTVDLDLEGPIVHDDDGE